MTHLGNMPEGKTSIAPILAREECRPIPWPASSLSFPVERRTYGRSDMSLCRARSFFSWCSNALKDRYVASDSCTVSLIVRTDRMA